MKISFFYLPRFKVYLDLLLERKGAGQITYHESLSDLHYIPLHTSCESTSLESEPLESLSEPASACKAGFFFGGSFAAISISNFLGLHVGIAWIIGYQAMGRRTGYLLLFSSLIFAFGCLYALSACHQKDPKVPMS